MSRDERGRKRRIFELLNRLGVQANRAGREYLEDGILRMMQDRSLLYNITGRLYPAIAKEFGVSAAIVSKVICNAISAAFIRGDLEELHRFFGNTISGSKGKPTNSEFMCMCARWLLLEEEDENEVHRTL